jgi:hypothetical protein
MTTSDLVNNFVSQFNKPFDLSMISNMIDRDPDEVKAELAELLTTEQIRLVDPEQGIYVRNNRFSARVGYNQKGNWTFDPMEASSLLDVIESGEYRSIRAIAKVIGRSHQWVFVYLEALASIGCIGMDGKRYVVKSCERVREIGKYIDAGILGRLRPKKSEEEKLRIAEEKERKRQLRLARDAAKEQALKEKLIAQAWFEYRESKWFWRIKFETFLKRKGLE